MKYNFTKRARWILLSALLFWSGFSLQAQQLTRLEYFFDKDPGVGKGSLINVSASATLDTSLQLGTGAIGFGLHTVFLRMQDAAGQWSLNYSSSFIKYPGADSVMKITAIEYYFDADPGFGKGTPLTITPADNISNLFNIVVPDNGNDSRGLHIRAQDSYGRWSLIADTTIDMCKLYKSTPNFGFIRYGSQYSFIDSSRINTAHSFTWSYDDNTSDTVINPVHSFTIGRHSVKLVAGKGCRADSIVKPLYTALESYSPKTFMAGGDMRLDLYGGGFDKDVAITLVDPSGKNYSPVAIQASTNKSHFTTQFDLHTVTGSTEKKWNIKLHFPNSNYDTVIQEAITVLPKPADTTQLEPRVTVTISMPGITGSNTWHHGTYTLTNTGFVTAKLVPFNFSVDDQLQDFRLTNVHISTDTSVVGKQIMDSTSLTDHLTVIFGDATHPSKVYSLLIPEIGPGQSITISYDFLTPVGLRAELRTYAWTGNRMLGSPVRDSWVNCMTYTVGNLGSALGLIPYPPAQVAGRVLSCGSSVFSQLYTLFTANPQSSQDVNNDVYNMGTAMGSTLLNCLSIGDFGKIGQISTLFKNNEAIGTAINSAQLLNSALENPCTKCWNDPVSGTTWNFASSDPNEMIGPVGADSIYHYVNGTSQLSYQVNFENKADAARAAQRVTLKDTLDAATMDISSFSLQHFIIGDSLFPVPSFRKEYTTTVDLSAKRNVLVRFNAKLDTLTNILTTDFISLDPVTKEVLTDTVLRGFLPPNTDKRSGTGSLVYSINQRNTNKTGDSIMNRAAIIFDNNAPILTNRWLNVVDTTRPTGKIANAKLQNDSTFTIYFSGSDNESGVRAYRVYVSVNNGPYAIVRKDVRDSLQITGSKDSTYRLYAVPLDYVNNMQLKNAQAELTVTLFDMPAIKGDSVVCAGSTTAFSNTLSGGTWSSSNNQLATIDASGMVTGKTAGTATITYSVTNNYFTRTATKTIRVKSLPARLTFNTTARLFCDKDSLVLGIIGLQAKDSLFWYTGPKVDSSQNSKKTFRDSATVTVYRKDSTGCGIFSDTLQLVRIVVPTPVITQQSDTLTSSIASGYEWYLNTTLVGGANSQKYKVMNSGTYNVRTTDTNGCKSALSANFAVLITAVSNIVMNNKDWQVFPNPVVNGVLHIHRNGTTDGRAQAQIRTSDGKLLGERRIGTDTQWDVRRLTNGIYYLRIVEKNAVSVYQFIKQ